MPPENLSPILTEKITILSSQCSTDDYTTVTKSDKHEATTNGPSALALRRPVKNHARNQKSATLLTWMIDAQSPVEAPTAPLGIPFPINTLLPDFTWGLLVGIRFCFNWPISFFVSFPSSFMYLSQSTTLAGSHPTTLDK